MLKSRYFVLLLVVFLVYVVFESIYKEINKKTLSAKAQRIECQNRTTTFEKVYLKNDIVELQELLYSGHYSLKSWVKKAKYSKTRLFEFVNLKDIDIVTKNIIKSYAKKQNNSEKKLKIEYYIYENDVDDPGKKTERSKLYAGYIVFRFLNDKNLLAYQVQIDFMDREGKDIPNSLKCAFDSFLTIDQSE